jgi:hypothetical protein
MMYDVAKVYRRGQFPRAAGAIAAQDEGTLACADQQGNGAGGKLR